jgi:hypothetical protein
MQAHRSGSAHHERNAATWSSSAGQRGSLLVGGRDQGRGWFRGAVPPLLALPPGVGHGRGLELTSDCHGHKPELGGGWHGGAVARSPPTHKHRRLPLGATLPADVGPHPDARAPGVGNQRNTSGGETTWDGATEDSVTSEWLVERASSGGEDKDVDGGRPT